MDAEEFLKQVNPAVRRSKLAPYLEDIRKLRGSGCTLEQVCEFLSSNGVTVSVAGLSSYLLRQEKQTTPAQKEKAKQPEAHIRKPAIEESTAQPEETKIPQKLADDSELEGLSSKQRRERYASSFIPEDEMSPAILKRIKKAKQ